VKALLGVVVGLAVALAAGLLVDRWTASRRRTGRPGAARYVAALAAVLLAVSATQAAVWCLLR